MTLDLKARAARAWAGQEQLVLEHERRRQEGLLRQQEARARRELADVLDLLKARFGYRLRPRPTALPVAVDGLLFTRGTRGDLSLAARCPDCGQSRPVGTGVPLLSLVTLGAELALGYNPQQPCGCLAGRNP